MEASLPFRPGTAFSLSSISLPPALVFQLLDMNGEFIHIGASDLGAGARLSQTLEATEAIIAYLRT